MVSAELSTIKIGKLAPLSQTIGWYVRDQGRLRKIGSAPALALYKDLFSEMSPDEMSSAAALPFGPMAPADPEQTYSKNALDTLPIHRAREVICTHAVGSGIEFGAGCRPMIVPLGSRVTYADRWTDEEVKIYSSSHARSSETQYVKIDIIDSFDKMNKIDESSQDFIIASHVIEHCPNPIGAIVGAYRRLKLGGRLILIIPDKHRTHDRLRPITRIEHLLADYYHPSHDRDLENYIERYHIVDKIPLSDFKFFEEKWRSNADVHLHTFDYTSVNQMIESIKFLAPFSNVWSHEGDLPSSKEMYFVLTK